jgi:hypothetical protein
VAERLLFTPLGSAVLHHVTKAKARILLPEIVEKETIKVLMKLTNDAADSMQRSSQLIQQLSGHPQAIIVPSEKAMAEALAERFRALAGIIERQPFTFEHSQAALSRIIDGTPPCGPNNEQFRDCCIWQVAIEKARTSPVHFVTNDRAFYQGGTHANGIAKQLSEECKRHDIEIYAHQNIGAYLSCVAGETTALDEKAIGDSIVAAIEPEVIRIANKENERELFGSKLRRIKITGHATPKESVIAVSFEAFYRIFEIESSDSKQQPFNMSLTGSCSFDPKTGQISEIEISEWTKGSHSGALGSHTYRSSPRSFMKFFEEGNFRILGA